MNMFRELNAYAEPDALESLITKLESTLCDGWLRDREGEARVRLFCSDGQVSFHAFNPIVSPGSFPLVCRHRHREAQNHGVN
jgi:hypothetical protein